MEYEQGQWIMRGLAASDPRRLRNLEDLIAAVDRMGFLPLFCNSVPGFSVEELTWPIRVLLAGKLSRERGGDEISAWDPALESVSFDGYAFEKVTHCSTGCGGCHDKVIDIISEILMGHEKV